MLILLPTDKKFPSEGWKGYNYEISTPLFPLDEYSHCESVDPVLSLNASEAFVYSQCPIDLTATHEGHVIMQITSSDSLHRGVWEHSRKPIGRPTSFTLSDPLFSMAFYQRSAQLGEAWV